MKIAKKRLKEGVERFRREFADQPTKAMGAILPAEKVERIVREEAGKGRDRTYPPLTILSLFIGQALSPDGACQDAVARHLSERIARNEAACSLNSGPYCKARQRLPQRLVERFAEEVGAALEQASPAAWRWRGRPVKMVDGTTVSMPDTAANQARYPQNGAQAPGLGFPLAMMVALISLATGAVLQWALGPCKGEHTGEEALFRTLMPSLDEGDIVLADRFYCTYFTAALLAQRGVDLVTRQHARRKTDFRRGRRLGRHDQEVQWQRPQRPSWMDLDTYERMPTSLRMRQIKVADIVLVTTLLDRNTVQPSCIADLYRLRWRIEVDLRSIKTVMGLDILRAKSPAMVDKEIAVHLLAYNLVCTLMARAAVAAGITARSLSFKGTVQLLVPFQQLLRWAGNRQARCMTTHLLQAIGSLILPFRPGRIEPRAVKRRPKPRSLLTVPRHVARSNLFHSRSHSPLR